jgi:hypothetical protein
MNDAEHLLLSCHGAQWADAGVEKPDTLITHVRISSETNRAVLRVNAALVDVGSVGRVSDHLDKARDLQAESVGQ